MDLTLQVCENRNFSKDETVFFVKVFEKIKL